MNEDFNGNIYRKRNIFLIIYFIFCFFVFISSFGSYLTSYIVTTLTYVLSFIFSDVSLISIISKYLIMFLFYFSFGILSFCLFLNTFKEIKYIILYSVLVNLLIIVMSMIIKSFFELNIADYLYKMIFTCLGIGLSFIKECISSRKKNC